MRSATRRTQARTCSAVSPSSLAAKSMTSTSTRSVRRPIRAPERSSRSARCIRTARRYRTTGLFVQDVVDIRRGSDRGALKANIGGRFTRVDVETFADRNLNGLGAESWRRGLIAELPGLDLQCGLTWQATDRADAQRPRRTRLPRAEPQRPGRARPERSGVRGSGVRPRSRRGATSARATAKARCRAAAA